KIVVVIKEPGVATAIVAPAAVMTVTAPALRARFRMSFMFPPRLPSPRPGSALIEARRAKGSRHSWKYRDRYRNSVPVFRRSDQAPLLCPVAHSCVGAQPHQPEAGVGAPSRPGPIKPDV